MVQCPPALESALTCQLWPATCCFWLFGDSGIVVLVLEGLAPRQSKVMEIARDVSNELGAGTLSSIESRGSKKLVVLF